MLLGSSFTSATRLQAGSWRPVSWVRWSSPLTITISIQVYTQIMSASPLRGRTKIQLACYTFKNY